MWPNNSSFSFPQQTGKVYMLEAASQECSVAGTVYRTISEAVHYNTTQPPDAARTNT